METYYAVGPRSPAVCFDSFLVSVRGKFCWTIYFREDDVVSEEEGLIFAESIRQVLMDIE